MPTRREALADFSSAEQVNPDGGPQGGVPSWGVFRPGR